MINTQNLEQLTKLNLISLNWWTKCFKGSNFFTSYIWVVRIDVLFFFWIIRSPSKYFPLLNKGFLYRPIAVEHDYIAARRQNKKISFKSFSKNFHLTNVKWDGMLWARKIGSDAEWSSVLSVESHGECKDTWTLTQLQHSACTPAHTFLPGELILCSCNLLHSSFLPKVAIFFPQLPSSSHKLKIFSEVCQIAGTLLNLNGISSRSFCRNEQTNFRIVQPFDV